MNVFRRSGGFTLVEIVVVIGIMAVLTVIIYSSFDSSRAQSRDQKRISDISTIQISLEQYFQKNGIYPLALSALTPVYMSEIPTDSTNNYNNNYFPITKTSGSSNCTSYQLWTKFERNNSYLNSKKGFNSTTLASNMYECGSGHITENASADVLVYDVMP